MVSPPTDIIQASSAPMNDDAPAASNECKRTKTESSARVELMPSAVDGTLEMVTKSPYDHCEYRYLVLGNGLKCLCVHDAKLDFSSAALDVHIGSMSDPPEFPGLAHFLEHLLFMGTAKYPQENDYNDFLSSHGGWSNAFTSDEHTNFFFEVSAEFLEPALDRFAQFFVEPLFGAGGDGSGTGREMRAVHSEHQKNVKDDLWRVHQLERHLSDPQHPFSKFGTGCLETLDKPAVVPTLKDFYRQNYSANVMGLVVYAKESLDCLEQWVRAKFAAVPNRQVAVPVWPERPWLADQHPGTLITVQSVKQMRSLHIVFPVKDMLSFYLTKPYNYYAHLIGHEGPTGLLAHLKRQNWALDLSAGPDEQYHGFAFFQVAIELTPEGLQHWQQVIKALFQYVRLTQEPQAWIFDECRQLGRLEFAFKDKESTATLACKLASQLHEYPPEHVLNGPDLMEHFDADLLRGVHADCFGADNFRCMLVHSEELTGSDVQEEQWYGTKYRVEPLPSKLLAELKDLDLERGDGDPFALPKPNDFIPTDLTVLGEETRETPSPPTCLKDTLFYKVDDAFGLPKAAAYFLVRSDMVYASARDNCRLALYVELLEDLLGPIVYDADLAGLQVKLAMIGEGVELRFSGFAHKLGTLVRRVLDTFVHLLEMAEAEQRFGSVKDKLERDLQSMEHNGSDWHASYLSTCSLQARFVHFRDKLRAVKDVGFGDLPRFSHEPVQVDALIMGSLTPEQATEIYDAVKSHFPRQAVIEPVQSVIFGALCESDTSPSSAKPSSYTIVPKERVPQPNHAIELYVQTARADDLCRRATTRLLWQVLHEHFFNTLRTKEQLGYVTFMQIRERSSVLGVRFLVQSHRDPMYLEERICKFVAQSRQVVEQMADEELAKHASALGAVLTERKKKLTQEAKLWWEYVKDGRLDFAGLRTDAQFIGTLAPAELRRHLLALLDLAPSLIVHVWGDLDSNGQPDALSAYQASSYPRIVVHCPSELPKEQLAPLRYTIPVLQQ
jgi:insulysin